MTSPPNVNGHASTPAAPAPWFRIPRVGDLGPRLGPYALAVLYVLADHANKAWKSWPSHQRIATQVGISTRQVIRAIGTLEEAGVIVVERFHGGVKNNRYQLVVAKSSTTGDCQSGVTNSHGGGDYQSHGGVTNSHGGGDYQSHELDPLNETQRTRPKELDPTPPPPPKGGGASAFEDFWNLYPKKENEEEARVEWKKLKPSPSLVAEILTAVEKRKLTTRWAEEGGRYVPLPNNYLAKKRWKDKLDDQPPTGRKRNSLEFEPSMASVYDTPDAGKAARN